MHPWYSHYAGKRAAQGADTREHILTVAEAAVPRGCCCATDALADMAMTLVESGLIVGRALQDLSVLPRQILLYRDFIRGLFAPD